VRDAGLLGAIELALERARQLYAMRYERDALCSRFDRLTHVNGRSWR
jgi:hypothetical protein